MISAENRYPVSGIMRSVLLLVDDADEMMNLGDHAANRRRIRQLGYPADKRATQFHRITLQPGESKTVEFTFGPDDLSFLDRDMRRVVEPGTFKIMVGGNSAGPKQKLNVSAK